MKIDRWIWIEHVFLHKILKIGSNRMKIGHFKSETEIIEVYEINQRLKRIESINRGKKFNELAGLFGLKESCPFDKLTVKQAEQERLLWKLVDLERGQHE